MRILEAKFGKVAVNQLKAPCNRKAFSIAITFAIAVSVACTHLMTKWCYDLPCANIC